MTPITQSIVDPDRGDCQRAVVASLLDLEPEQVPHFRLFNDAETYWSVYHCFLWSLGWEWDGASQFHEGMAVPRANHSEYHINGYVDATVPSRSFTGCYHAVVMDLDGLIVHDPNPNKAWEGINVVETCDLVSWNLIKPLER